MGIKSIALAILTFVLSSGSRAAEIYFEYSDTILFTNIAGLSAGDSVKVTVSLDNGGTTDASQTWATSDLQSVTWDFNNGGLVTTFSSPFDAGLDPISTGNFVTDESGNLTSVMSNWSDGYSLAPPVVADFTTTGNGLNFAWFLNGVNSVYFQNNYNEWVDLAKVSNMLNTANWYQMSPVPVPAAIWLFGSGLIGLISIARRKKA